MARLKKLYQDKTIKNLIKLFGYKSIMQAPKIVKITLNMGLGEAASNKKVVDNALQDMTLIAGRKPVVTRVKNSIAGFKIREGWPIGCKVTLRREQMYEFLDRLISIAIPRIRDFRGFSIKSFDGRGNYSFGISEQIVFPEIEYDKIDSIRGLDICITTTANTNDEAWALMTAFNFPFKEKFENRDK